MRCQYFITAIDSFYFSTNDSYCNMLMMMLLH